MRKYYSANFKAEIALEILKEEKSITEISSEYGIHPTQLRRWKEEAIINLPKVFVFSQGIRCRQGSPGKEDKPIVLRDRAVNHAVKLVEKKSGIDPGQS